MFGTSALELTVWNGPPRVVAVGIASSRSTRTSEFETAGPAGWRNDSIGLARQTYVFPLHCMETGHDKQTHTGSVSRHNLQCVAEIGLM